MVLSCFTNFSKLLFPSFRVFVRLFSIISTFAFIPFRSSKSYFGDTRKKK